MGWATYYNPDGSVAWGPRYLAHVCPLLALGVGAVLERAGAMGRPARTAVRSGMAALAVAGAVVTFASLWVPYPYSRNEVNDVPGWQLMTADELSEIRARDLSRHFNDWRWSPIAVNLRSLDDAGRYMPGFPLRWWRGGPSAVGVVTLVTAMAGIVAAIRAASRSTSPTTTSKAPMSLSMYSTGPASGHGSAASALPSSRWRATPSL